MASMDHLHLLLRFVLRVLKSHLQSSGFTIGFSSKWRSAKIEIAETNEWERIPDNRSYTRLPPYNLLNLDVRTLQHADSVRFRHCRTVKSTKSSMKHTRSRHRPSLRARNARTKYIAIWRRFRVRAQPSNESARETEHRPCLRGECGFLEPPAHISKQ